MTVHRRGLAVVGLSAAVAMAVASCSSTPDQPQPTSSASKPASAKSSAKTSATASGKPSPAPATTTSTRRPTPAGLVGDGCADYLDDVPAGPGSLEGMSRDPVVVAFLNSPVLTTLAGALTGRLNPEVDLTEKLNGGQFTFFAPTDDAWGRVPAETVDKLRTDPQLLTSVLNYHVVPDRADPKAVLGEHKTVQGQSLNVTGGGDSLRVNDAGVLCGGIKTANATVYLIDRVLMPPPPAPATSTTSTPGQTSSDETTSEETTSTTPTS